MAVNKNFKAVFSVDGVDLLGWLVHYRVGDFEMPHKEFVSLLKKHNISTKSAPTIIARNAVIRAIQDFARSRAKGKGQRQDQTFHKDISEKDSKESVWMVLDLEVDRSAQDVELGTKIRVAFDKDKKTISVTGGAAGVAQEIENLYQSKLGMFTEDQFRSFTKRFIESECSCIDVREGGGIYFIPSTQRENLDTLQALFESIPKESNADLTEIAIPDLKSTGNRETMWKSATEGLEKELEKMTTDFEEKKDSLTEKQITNRLASYMELRTKISMYELVFRDKADELSSKLQKLEGAIQKKAGL